MSESNPNTESLFAAALAMESPEERANYLDEACGADRQLRAQVEELLAAYPKVERFLESPARGSVATIDESARSARPGTIIGPYKLLQQIGEGGMGTVFMAEQMHPVQRKVALKIIKAGMDSRQVIARFEAERQALAVMDHVNIARVLDAGATEAGRPFFVMELVHGVPITKYCDDNHLTPRERLELFVPVCQAIQHAHQKGIIHRDIKPSNVMVTLYDGKPVPKVIDFGVAKATEQKLTERTLFTQYGTMVGTLEYMSPEQAEMSALGVDTRSDIYSLGVLLYELLTGSTPLTHKRMKEEAYAEILRMIKEEEPQKPSTRLSDSGEALASISAMRKTEPAKLSRLMRGELDWIVMKCLEKDRDRRYDTANAFAADVQRYLSDEAVQACPPSTWYRFRKFVRRNKAVLAFAACLFVMLSVLTGSLGWVARDRALRRFDLEREANRAVADARQLQGQSKWPEALAAAQRARGLLAGAEISPELRQGIDDLESDLVMVLRLEEIHGQPVQPDFHTGQELDAGYAKVFRDYGIDIEALDPGAAAERIRGRSIRQQLAMALDDWAGMRRRKPGDQSWKTLVEIAREADPDEWRTRFRDALLQGDRPGLERLAESIPISELPPGTLHLLGKALLDIGALDKGMALLQDAQQRYPGDLWLNDILAAASLWGCQPPRLDDALRYYTAALAVRPDNYRLHDMVGLVLGKKKSWNAALVAYARAIEIRPGDPHCWTARAVTYYEMGQYDKAIADNSKAIELDPKYAMAWRNRGTAYFRQCRLDEAIADLSKAIELKPKYAGAWNNRGAAYSKLGQLDKAIADCSKAIGLDPKFAMAWSNRGEDYSELGQLDKAIADCSKAIELDPKYAGAWNNRGAAFAHLGQPEKAIADYQEAIRLKPDFASAHKKLAWILATCADPTYRNPAEAVALAGKAVELEPKNGGAWNTFGVSRYRAGDWKGALDALQKSTSLRNGGDANDWFFLAMAHWKLDEKEPARKWYDRAVQSMDKNAPKDEELLRFRGEAEELLGIGKKKD